MSKFRLLLRVMEDDLDDMFRRGRLLRAHARHVCRDTRWLQRCLTAQRTAIETARDLRLLRLKFALERRQRKAE